MTHPLDEAIALTPRTVTDSGGVFAACTHPAFNNMVGPFGGITAAQMLAAVQAHPGVHGRPAAQTVNFTSPLTDGEFDIELGLARTNNSNQHWTFAARQGDATPVTGTLLTVKPRASFDDQELTPPSVPAPEDLEPAQSFAPMEWLKNYEWRFVEGMVSPTGAERSQTTFWLRHTQPRAWDAVSLASAADSFFPRVFLRAGSMVPAGTITMTTYFLGTDEDYAAAGEFLLCTATADRYHAGAFNQRASVFSDAGALLATSTQLVYFKH